MSNLQTKGIGRVKNIQLGEKACTHYAYDYSLHWGLIKNQNNYFVTCMRHHSQSPAPSSILDCKKYKWWGTSSLSFLPLLKFG